MFQFVVAVVCALAFGVRAAERQWLYAAMWLVAALVWAARSFQVLT